MRILAPGAAAITLVLAGTACSEALTPETLAGTYSVSVFEITSVGTPTKQHDWIALGANMIITIGADGSFSTRYTWNEAVGEDVSGLIWSAEGVTALGSIAIDGSSVTITFASDSGGNTFSGTISRSGDTLTLNLTDAPDYDFENDGTLEPVTGRVVATRTS